MAATFRFRYALGTAIIIVFLSVATVWAAYSLVGNWPPYYTAYIASGCLATASWLLIALISRQAICFVLSRSSLSTLLSTMTVIAAVCAGIRCLGFYPTLFASLVMLLLASLIAHDSNQLDALRRTALRRLFPVRAWLPGAFAGGLLFLGIHSYDVYVGMLNAGRLDFSNSLVVMFVYCCLAGASMQVIVHGGWSALSGCRTDSAQP